MNCVWKVDWLVEGLFKPEDGNRLAKPAGNDERRHHTHYDRNTQSPNGKYRYEQLRHR